MEALPPSPPTRRKIAMPELMYLSTVWKSSDEPPLYSIWMASSEVDQKFLGYFANTTSTENNYLSSFLFRVLGLSVILAEKLLRARRARRLDPARDLKARHLIHHILWLAREGLVMVEQYILPMVGNYGQLKVLSYKLRASFYHIFVLFHNDPPVNDRVVRSRSPSHGSVGGTYGLFPDPLDPRTAKSKGPLTAHEPIRSPSGRKRATDQTVPVHPHSTPRTPPGLPLPDPFSVSRGRYMNGSTKTAYAQDYYGTYQPSRDDSLATYFMAYKDYTPHATAAFKAASALADNLLPGSHPVRLTVKVEYVAYVYDCLKEYELSRRMARQAIRQVYDAQEGMDDESFEDAAEMVGILGRMMRRGLTPASHSGSDGREGLAGRFASIPVVPADQGVGSGPTRTRSGSSNSSASRSGSGRSHTRSRSDFGSSSRNARDVRRKDVETTNSTPSVASSSRRKRRPTSVQPTSWV